ncbi:MAG: mercury resistance system transport protein MerF [Gemmatimonadales bacterium]|nr:mercury resistance system transport protein MerF [Gemmatimonadales bacterium]MDZ4390275.1 mercury resistance system transport protein MerF [Gemmatimonadales bacterium]
MKNSTLFKTGLAGSIIAALCCFTPVLVITLTALGLAAWVGYIDLVVLPLLVVFVVVAVVAWQRMRRDAACDSGSAANETEEQ